MSGPAYATRAELYQYGVSAAALSGFVDTAMQDSALLAASRFADSYLNARFALPLTVWGDDLRQVVCQIAAYRLMGLRGFSPETQDAPQFRDFYKDAIDWLMKVSQGKVTPLEVKDSDTTGANNTDNTGNAQNAPFVVAGSQDDGASAPDFWHPTNSSGSSGKRGW